MQPLFRPEIFLLVTDRNLSVVGDPITQWDTLDCTLRFNEPASGMFTAPAYPWIRQQIDAGNRIVVIRAQQVFMAGPIERYMIEKSDNGENAGIGKITVYFADDLALIAGRLVYPDPSLTPPQQTGDFWEFTGNAETAIRNLVNLNAGPGALAPRQVPKLVLGSPAGVGTSATVKSGWEPLLDVARKAALDGGGLGFRTRQVGTQIVFETYQPADLTGQIRFGFGLGNLRYLAYERQAPTATTAIVGGQGEGAGKFVTERNRTADETTWWRLETLVPQPGDIDLSELEKEGDDALAETSETARLQTAAYDTDDMRFGIDYGLGDRVSVQIDTGLEISELVRLVHLQAWATAGELVSAMVGTQEASHDPEWVKRLRDIDRRVGQVERRMLPAA
jgi:hypothetical protein